MKHTARSKSVKSSARSAQSVAGEEDPGAALDTSTSATATNPGDDAPPGTLGTGEAVCGRCGGSGRVGGAPCPTCGGSGKVIHGVGGG